MFVSSGGLETPDPSVPSNLFFCLLTCCCVCDRYFGTFRSIARALFRCHCCHTCMWLPATLCRGDQPPPIRRKGVTVRSFTNTVELKKARCRRSANVFGGFLIFFAQWRVVLCRSPVGTPVAGIPRSRGTTREGSIAA